LISPRELSIILASLEYWADNHDDDDPYDQMSEDMEQETFGEAGQPAMMKLVNFTASFISLIAVSNLFGDRAANDPLP
jgi:hypothetical protein